MRAPGAAGAIRLVAESDYRWRIDPVGDMRVPGIVFAAAALLPALSGDRALEQVANVATLPGIVRASYAMPDVHWGYGFPIGGVAATDIDATGGPPGVVSPGGVGFDISCGVRLLASPLDAHDVTGVLAALMDALARVIPVGMGRGAVRELDRAGLDRVLVGGAAVVVADGYGEPRDLTHCEDGGVLPGADPGALSAHAVARGLHQLGSLGSGNHFLEVQVVDRVLDDTVASGMGLHAGQVCVMIHCGSRGLGHQVCSDHVAVMEPAMSRYGIHVPDRQLACAPVRSPEGEAYLAAMAAAANYARANRQMLTVATRRAFAQAAGTDRLELVYDVSHNLAKVETHTVDGRPRRLCVHRKGATRALPPGHPDLPEEVAPVGQPVLVPGSMGTASYVLVGEPGNEAFASACHGAGRVMSRTAARRGVSGRALRAQLAAAGIEVRAPSDRGLAEEAPSSYKDVDAVVASVAGAGLARPVARLVPVGVIKG